MGVGGGFVAIEPGGERIVSLAGAALGAGQPLPSSRERLDSEPRVGGRPRLSSAAFVAPTHARWHDFRSPQRPALIVPARLSARSIAEASLGAVCGIHDKAPPVGPIAFRSANPVLCGELGPETVPLSLQRVALHIELDAASNSVNYTSDQPRAMRLLGDHDG